MARHWSARRRDARGLVTTYGNRGRALRESGLRSSCRVAGAINDHTRRTAMTAIAAITTPARRAADLRVRPTALAQHTLAAQQLRPREAFDLGPDVRVIQPTAEHSPGPPARERLERF